jgi:upstream activation factor subunit UAF30
MFAKYTKRIVEILETSDLDKVSAKQIRKQIQRETGVDFGPQKSEFNKFITDLYLDLMDKVSTFKSTSKPLSPKLNAHSIRTETIPTAELIVTPTQQQINTSQRSPSPKNAPIPVVQNVAPKEVSPTTVHVELAQDESQDDVYIKEEVIHDSMPESMAVEYEEEEIQSSQVSSRGKKKSKRVLSSDRVDSDDEPSPSRVKKRKTPKAKSSPPKNSGWTAPCKLSPELATLLNSEELPRTQVVKKLWEYIKGNGLQDPKDKRYVITDDKLYTVLGVKRVHFMKMNQHLSKHITKIETGAPKATASPSKKGGGNGFTKIHQLSPPLAALLGVEKLPRTQVVKRLWELIKQRKLQDPKNGTVINNDEEMQTVFKTASMTMFEMNKVLMSNSSYWVYI